MSPPKLKTIILTTILIIATPYTLFANLSIDQTDPEEEEDLQPRATGLVLSHVDGWVSGVEPSPFIGEWGDAHMSEISLLGTNGAALPAVQIHTKVVMDRMQIGLNVPMGSSGISFEEVKVTYDTNPDGALSNGDARLSFSSSGI